MKLRTVLLGIAAFSVAGLLLLVVAWAIWLHVEKSRVAEIQAEMRAEGLPMTAADLEPAPLAETDNAAPLLERAAELFKELKKREGWIDAVPAPGTKGERNLTNFDEAKLARLRQQMAWPETQEALRLLREAATKPGARFHRDVTKGPAMELGPVTEFIVAARLLGVAAWLHARDGDVAGAAMDLEAASRLGGLAGRSPVLIDWLVAVALDSLAVSMTSGVVAELPPPALDDPVWDRLSAFWGERERGMQAGLVHAFDGERVLAGGWIFERMLGQPGAFADLWKSASGGNDEMDKGAALSLAVYAHPWSPLLHADHAAYLQFMQDVRRSVEEGDVGGNAAAGIPKSALFTRLAAPALDNIPLRSREIAAQLQLGQVGLALERWRAEHGSYPETLAALRLPESDTTDPFNGQPFLYRVEEDGVLLYSVGKNGKDDGGTTEKRGDLVWQVRRQAVKPEAP